MKALYKCSPFTISSWSKLTILMQLQTKKATGWTHQTVSWHMVTWNQQMTSLDLLMSSLNQLMASLDRPMTSFNQLIPSLDWLMSSLK